MTKNIYGTWYKDAIIYQLHVQSFFDSNDDGTGDFQGMITKLDYLNSLGVNALWLLPFYPSPMKDGGYDISDFNSIHPSYGSLYDFRKFIREAHKRGIRIITELVLNHTSSQHRWFQRARKSKPGSTYRNYYVWSDTPEKYKDTRIIFQDFETSNWTYDPEAKSYYWHRFYSHQPDLNFDNPAVQKEMFRVIDFWFGIGVDGLRLDAVPYLFEREGTNCENLPETHQFLKKLRAYVDKKYENKMLLAEANQWPDDARQYFGNGDECHMAFNFPLMPRLYMAMNMEDNFPVIDILEQIPPIPENCQWAIFLRNHDELTLEMVSDEERDYMYKSFTRDPKQRINLGIRRRLAPLMENDRRRIEMMNILLLSLPGTPIIYYGDEIGMGDNYYLGDRYGVRTPMQWSADKNAGFSKCNPQQLFLPVILDYEYHYEAVNVDSQERNFSSLLWWMRQAIAQRKRHQAFNRGSIRFIKTNNTKILAFLRESEEEVILVITNLSKYSQSVSLELEEFKGYTPVEIFSQNKFPDITDDPYNFIMQYRDYFWFHLTKHEELAALHETRAPHISMSIKEWNTLAGVTSVKLQDALSAFIKNRRWFRGKSKKIKTLVVDDIFTLGKDRYNYYLFFVRIEYIASASENYLISGKLATGSEITDISSKNPRAILATVDLQGEKAVLYEASYSQEFQSLLFDLIFRKDKIKGKHGEIYGLAGKYLRNTVLAADLPLSSSLVSAEQSNSSILYANSFFLKIYRSPDEGNNPELEIIRKLTEKTKFESLPPYAGSIEYIRKNERYPLAIMVGFIPNQGNAWDLVENFIDMFFENVLTRLKEFPHPPAYTTGMLEEYKPEDAAMLTDLAGYFCVEMIRKLGQRTAEMHLALASVTDDESFRPENFSLLYQKSINQSFRTLIRKTISELRMRQQFLEGKARMMCDKILNHEAELLKATKNLLESEKIRSQKIRVHGDYHLGQVLFTGKDFIIIDFEGEPARPMSSRRLKYCPFKDVAGMLRSFHYAIYMGYYKAKERTPENIALLEPWIEHWYQFVCYHFLHEYLKTADNAPFIPLKEEQIVKLLNLYLIEKAVYESSYEINNRPDWLIVPLNGLDKIINNLVLSEQITLQV